MSMTINCECGYVVRGESQAELIERAERHVDETHPDLKGRISRQAFLAMATEE